VLIVGIFYMRMQIYRWQQAHWVDASAFSCTLRARATGAVAVRVSVPRHWYRAIATLFEQADVDQLAENHGLARRLIMVFRGVLVSTYCLDIPLHHETFSLHNENSPLHHEMFPRTMRCSS